MWQAAQLYSDLIVHIGMPYYRVFRGNQPGEIDHHLGLFPGLLVVLQALLVNHDSAPRCRPGMASMIFFGKSDLGRIG